MSLFKKYHKDTKISYLGSVNSVDELPADAEVGSILYNRATGLNYLFIKGSWSALNIDLFESTSVFKPRSEKEIDWDNNVKPFLDYVGGAYDLKDKWVLIKNLIKGQSLSKSNSRFLILS